MRIQLSGQAKECLGKSELVIIPERIDDVALLIGQMVMMGFPEVFGQTHPSPLEATGAQLGVYGSDVAGVYPHRRRSP